MKDKTTQLDEENAQFKISLAEANDEIIRLKLALSTASTASTDLTKAQADTAQLTLNNRTFIQISSGPNAGLWCEHGLLRQNSTADRILYQDTAVLSEYKHIDIGGVLTDEIVIEGVTYHRISTGDHKGKMVQKVGLESFLTVGGKCYIEWNIRKKVEIGF